ncbi:Phosphoribosyl-AMP cyclohydrolase [Heracleum sosnowskyi]|uniref:Phosphoribosyl-AMP cyclohydrolase n=1 Tax=Heracleum sosnowskyi TaxID=360622 RepID=A0AAD8J566_9APIA|nr:Phosphoribosyl-AMP cyclohydrolase [Heracleum sosnowskyi]
MALPTCTISLPTFSMKLLNRKSCPLNYWLTHVARNPISATRCVRLPTRAQLYDPSRINLHMNNIRERLWYVIPNPIKEFPWKKAETIALKQFLLTAKEALKWALVAVLIFGSISDVIFSISINKELLIPFGLIVGCMIANFLKEILRELFPNSEQEGDLSWSLLAVSCFFVMVKILASYVTQGRQVIISHAANGVLMQILLPWRTSQEDANRDDEKNSVNEVSATMDFKD